MVDGTKNHRAPEAFRFTWLGLAKALEGDRPDAAASELSQSPTLTRHGTAVGVILGTAAYMSPEQAKGKKVDERADVWAFGAVLYEMLVGQRLFSGETVSDVLAAVLRADIDWSKLPAETPEPLRRLLRRCLTREPARRLPHIGAARLEIEDALAPSDKPATTVSARAHPVNIVAAGALALLAVVAVYSVSLPPIWSSPTSRISAWVARSCCNDSTQTQTPRRTNHRYGCRAAAGPNPSGLPMDEPFISRAAIASLAASISTTPALAATRPVEVFVARTRRSRAAWNRRRRGVRAGP